MKIQRKHSEILLEFSYFAIPSLIGFFMLLLGYQENKRIELQEAIPLIVGLQIAVAIYSFKSSAIKNITETLRIIEILETYSNIPPDKELQDRAHRAIKDFKEVLDKLRNRIIVDKGYEILQLLCSRLDNAQSGTEILACHWIESSNDAADFWNSKDMNDYYQSQLRAIGRDCEIKRIFLIDDKMATRLKRDVREIMKKQEDDGISVRILSKDKVQNNRKEDRGEIEIVDFLIIGDMLQKRPQARGTIKEIKYQENREVFLNTDEVRLHKEKFHNFWEIADSLTSWINQQN